MAFTYKNTFECDAANSTEVLTLTPSPLSVAPFAVKIASASYGNDTTDVVVSEDRLSITLHVNNGVDSLVVTVISPNETDGAFLKQDAIVLNQFVLIAHADSCRIYIQGS